MLVRIVMSVALIMGAAPVFAQTLAAGNQHTAVLKSDGAVWTIGFNQSVSDLPKFLPYACVK